MRKCLLQLTVKAGVHVAGTTCCMWMHVCALQVDNHLLAELQVVLADKAALEEEKAAAQVSPDTMHF